MKKNLMGNLLVLISAAGFGIMGIVAKIAYQEGATAISVLVMRYITAAVLMWLYNALTGRLKKVRLGRDHLARTFCWAVFFMPLRRYAILLRLISYLPA